jgi:preprotein translocase subunit SecD
VPAAQDAAFRNALTEVDVNYDRSQSGDSYNFTLKPNIVVQLREDTVNQALQTIERRVNELGVAEPIIARHSAADQILVQMPGVTDVARAKEIIQSTALLELKQVRARAVLRRERRARRSRRQCAARHGDPARRDFRVAGSARQHRLLRRQEGSRRDGPRSPYRAADARREQSSRGELLAQPGGARKFGAFTQTNIGRQLGIVLDKRVQSAPSFSRASTMRPHHRQLHQPGSAGPVAEAALGRAAGEPDLSRRTHGRPVARRRFGPRRRAVRARAACCW